MKGAYVITEPCLYMCTEPRVPREKLKHPICIDVCPVNGIHSEPGTDRMLYIDPEGCISCGACFWECPVEAIYAAEDVPAAWAEYITLNAKWFHGDREWVRQRIEEITPIPPESRPPSRDTDVLGSPCLPLRPCRS
jgi:NAD-dependent dihydropyrimidine dehydrogenase PreA subunit